jgi:hypothetical protein
MDRDLSGPADPARGTHITQSLQGLLIYSPGDAEHTTQPV